MTSDNECLHAIQGRIAPVGELDLAPDRFARLPGSAAGTWGETGRTAELEIIGTDSRRSEYRL
jgi:hypothetical protein